MKYFHLGILLTLFTSTLLKEGQGSCSQNWLNYGTECILIQSEPLSSLSASFECHFQGGKLTSISSVETLEFLSMHLNSYQGQNFWVGLAKGKSNDSLYWRDNEPADEQAWVRISSSNESTSTETAESKNCFVFNGEMVQAKNCNSTYGYLCTKYKTLFNPEEYCLRGHTEHSFIGEASGDCLYRSPDATKLSNAGAKCAETGGRFLDLDEVVREGLSSFVDHHVMTNDGYKYWTAMTYNDSKVYWKSGLQLEIILPLIPGSGSCVTVSFNYSTFVTPQLYQTECEDHAHVLCAARVRTTVETPSQRMLEQTQAQMSCPRGQNWKAFRGTGYCFWETSFETHRVSWDDARAFCQAYGGDLASFHSIHEEKIGLSFQYGSLAHPYWIGLRLDPETETYNWADGTPLDYQNWAPGHPDHKDKRRRCVAMDAAAKHWISSLCGIISWFVCKAPKQLNPSAPIIPTRAPLTTCGRTNQFYFRGYCYEVVSLQVSWHRAKEYCENRGSSLVSIHTDDEIGFLLRMLYDDKSTRGNRVWIGLSSLSGTFRWTDLTPVDMTYWNKDEPNNYLNQEKCCNMYMGNGLWNDENCNIDMGFICKEIEDATDMPVVITTLDPLIGNCKKGFYPYYDSCYLPIGFSGKGAVNWTTANDICQTLGGGLVSVRDDREQAFLSYLMQGLKQDTWIGLHDTILSGRYFWTDNSYMRYTNWAVGEPSFFGIQEDCVKMVYDDVDSGVWKDDLCSRELPYICKEAKDPNLPKPIYNRGMNCIHPEGWLKLDAMCFKMFSGNLLTWSEAENACQQEGAHLVSISGTSIQAAVAYLSTEVNQTFWIGLEYKKSTQEFEWLNGWKMTFSKWGKDEPSVSTSEDSCLASLPDSYWRGFPCKEQMPYICQITTGKSPSVKKYGGDCPKSSDEWMPTDGSFCHSYGRNRADWFSATLKCFRQGGFLISLHSFNDIEMVKKTLKKSELVIQSVYIGLITNHKGGFYWIDHTPLDFVNWENGEPDNEIDSCVEMITSSFKWRVVSCSAVKNYICSHPKDKEVDGSSEAAKLGDDASSGISVAALSGILVGVLLVVAIVIGVWFFRPSLGKTRFRIPFRQHSMSFENALYNVDSSSMELHDDRKDSFDSR